MKLPRAAPSLRGAVAFSAYVMMLVSFGFIYSVFGFVRRVRSFVFGTTVLWVVVVRLVLGRSGVVTVVGVMIFLAALVVVIRLCCLLLIPCLRVVGLLLCMTALMVTIVLVAILIMVALIMMSFVLIISRPLLSFTSCLIMSRLFSILRVLTLVCLVVRTVVRVVLRVEVVRRRLLRLTLVLVFVAFPLGAAFHQRTILRTSRYLSPIY